MSRTTTENQYKGNMKTFIRLLTIALLCNSARGRAEFHESSSTDETLAIFNRTGAYFSKTELDNMIHKCKSSEDVERIFGKPFGATFYSNGDILWTYYAPPNLNVHDGVAGFSMRLDSNGQILWWEPIMSNR